MTRGAVGSVVLHGDLHVRRSTGSQDFEEIGVNGFAIVVDVASEIDEYAPRGRPTVDRLDARRRWTGQFGVDRRETGFLLDAFLRAHPGLPRNLGESARGESVYGTTSSCNVPNSCRGRGC